MPDLIQSLRGRDLGFLRIAAELWGVEFDAPDARMGVNRLGPLLLDAELAGEVIDALPEDAQGALRDLMSAEGRLPWALFVRRYGEVREMGPAKRDRERPYRSPETSASEALWYRAMVARHFFDTADGPEEFAYIPEDLLALLPFPAGAVLGPMGRPASPAERKRQLLADDSVLDDACTLLAALRAGLDLAEVETLLFCGADTAYPLTSGALISLLRAASLLDNENTPLPEPTRLFLESSRSEALAKLAAAWLHSYEFNELGLLPSVEMEGEWRNDPLRTRNAVLDLLATLPGFDDEPGKASYWSLSAFVADARTSYPDYQRPAGDYDSWYLKDRKSGKYLRGFEHWDAVDGELLRFTITGPLHWLGILDLASPLSEELGKRETTPSPVSAFRFSRWAPDLLSGLPPSGLHAEDALITVRADGRLRAPQSSPRSARYQIARFSNWQGHKDGFYRYRITPSSLRRAQDQGLHVKHLIALLNRHAAPAPPSLLAVLERWAAQGEEARIERISVLRLRDPDLLQKLRKSRAGRFLGDPLGPAAIEVRPGAEEQVLAALVELGVLGEMITDEAQE